MKISNELYYLFCAVLSIAISIPLVNSVYSYLPAPNTAAYHFVILGFGCISAAAATLILDAVKSLIGSPKKNNVLDDEAPTDSN